VPTVKSPDTRNLSAKTRELESNRSALSVARTDTRRRSAELRTLRKGMASLEVIEPASSVAKMDTESLTALELSPLRKSALVSNVVRWVTKSTTALLLRLKTLEHASDVETWAIVKRTALLLRRPSSMELKPVINVERKVTENLNAPRLTKTRPEIGNVSSAVRTATGDTSALKLSLMEQARESFPALNVEALAIPRSTAPVLTRLLEALAATSAAKKATGKPTAPQL